LSSTGSAKNNQQEQNVNLCAFLHYCFYLREHMSESLIALMTQITQISFPCNPLILANESDSDIISVLIYRHKGLHQIVGHRV
jgi:hypothetical protein